MMKKITACGIIFYLLPLHTFADKREIEEISVLGHHAQVIGQGLTASEGIVSQADLAIRPLLRTGEILEAVPGMVATQHSGSGKANQYFLRGFNLDHGTDFATSIDGMPINMRTHGHGQGYTDLNFIIPEMVASIHYKKGPYYADVGDFSGAGSAELFTTTAEKNSKGSGRLSLAVGEEDFYRALAVGETGLLAGKLNYGLEHQLYRGPWDSINEDVGKTNLWLKQQWSAADSSFDLLFMGYDNSWNSADQIPARAIAQGLITDLGSIDTSLGGESSRYSVSGSLQHTRSNADVLQMHIYAIAYDMNLWSNFSYFTDPDGDQFQQIDQRKIYGGDISYSHTSELSGRAMLNTFGLETRFDDIEEVGLRRSYQRQITASVRTDAVDELSKSFYWQNKFALTPALSSVFGIRYDHFTFDVVPLSAAYADSLSVNGGKAEDDIITSSFSLAYKLNPQQEIYTSLGEGFHSNDARGITLRVDPVDGQPLAAADPLVPTLGYEIGWRGNFDNDLNVSLALWQLEIDAELIFVGDEGTTEDTGTSSTRKGIELTSYYRFNHHWMFDLEYAYSEAEFDQPLDGSRRIPGALDHVISAGINWQINDQVFSHLRMRHIAAYMLDGGATADASSLVNFRLGYQATANLKITLDILNLFNSSDHDIDYFYSSQLPGELAPVDDLHYHRFEPRNLRLSAELSF